MAIKFSSKAIFFTVMGIFAVCVAIGCWLLSLPEEQAHYVPTEELIRTKPTVQPFILQADKFQGIYGNMEVASLIFRYQTSAEPGESWTRQVDAAAAAAGWKKTRSEGPELYYQRLLRSEPTVRRRATSEEIRVHRLPTKDQVLIAWMLVDNKKRPDPIAEGPKADWAREEFWPRYEQAKDR